jgi:hypothetical protein
VSCFFAKNFSFFKRLKCLILLDIRRICKNYLPNPCLTNWCFDEFEKVTFDKKSFDIKIGDKERGSFGKGYRAFLYAAFVISIMRYTVKNQLIHPGVVILDSPLVTLKEKEIGADVPDKMQNAMFNDLAKNNAEQQVIIFENKQPTAPIEGKVNRVVFTKNYTDGRYGFINIKNT